MTEIGFGTWSWGNKFLWGYQAEKDDQLLKKTFKAAIDSGLTLIDTADSYGTGNLTGRSETLLGKYLEELPLSKKRSITIATKLAPYPWRVGRKGFKHPFKLSKKRLKGKIDRVQLHWSTYRYAPWQEAQLIDGLGDLYENGDITEIGVSNMGPRRLRWMHNRLTRRGIPLKSIQIQFSLLSPQNNKKQIQDICKELNIQLLAYSPLALGVLAVKPSDDKVPKAKTLLRKILFNRLLPGSIVLRKELERIARERGVSQAQVALNWCRSHGAHPIPGIRTPLQARDIGSARRWKLSDKEKASLDKLSNEVTQRMPNNPFLSD